MLVINSLVTEHLRKYFDLAFTHYMERNWGLAAFFAVTVIEECAKMLYLRDANLKDKKDRKNALSHSEKHIAALFNLLSGSDRFEALPEEWQELAWSWFSGRKLMQMRNKGLYVWFNNRKELTAPNESVSSKEAALLIYLSGFTAVELAEYVDLDIAWVNDMSRVSEAFRVKHLVIPQHIIPNE